MEVGFFKTTSNVTPAPPGLAVLFDFFEKFQKLTCMLSLQRENYKILIKAVPISGGKVPKLVIISSQSVVRRPDSLFILNSISNPVTVKNNAYNTIKVNCFGGEDAACGLVIIPGAGHIYCHGIINILPIGDAFKIANVHKTVVKVHGKG